MSGWTWLLVGIATWLAFMALALAWLRESKAAGERWDRTMADHLDPAPPVWVNDSTPRRPHHGRGRRCGWHERCDR